MSPRPLVRRAPNGMRYTTPSGAPNPPRQSTNGHESGPESTPAQRREPRAKLDADDVRAIRADYAAGRWKQPDLAYIYGVTQSTISSVVTGDTWRHLTTEPQPTEQENDA
jgi:hypothetical protein